MSLAEFCATLHRICRKRNIRSRTDPGFLTPGARMTVVYTNSLKLVDKRQMSGQAFRGD